MKYALVTGATKGIGYAISAALIDAGFFVYMNYAHDDAAAAAILFRQEQFSLLKADLSTQAGAEHLIDELRATGNLTLDCVVLNTGLTTRKAFADVQYGDWTQVMDANVNIPFFLVQRLQNCIRDHGSIVFIGSDMGIYPHAVSVAYSTSKAAVHMLAQSLVKEFAPRKIRVNAIAPGFVDTEWQKEKPDWLREKIAGKIALGRFASPEEIADSCMFLVRNGYVNGSVLQIDGGYCFE